MPETNVVLDLALSHTKTTGGTHVFGNEDAGFKGVYIPKPFFQGKKVDANTKLRIVITIDE